VLYTSPVAAKDIECDVCVIGGGPAGMIAAGRAAAAGRRVVLLEKNSEPGRKLLMTGGGRCNVTNAETHRHVLVEKYGSGGKVLHSLFARFGPEDLRRFLSSRGLETVVEAEDRVFPVTQSAASVLDVLLAYMAEGLVELRTGCTVTSIEAENRPTADPATADPATADPADRTARITCVRAACAGSGPAEERTIRASSFILATGGTSHPETGSTGDGFRWLRELGHRVREPVASLVPVRVREVWVRTLQGVALDDVRLTATGPSGRLSERGKLLFTHFGLSGPLVLNVSTPVSRLGPPGKVELSLDLYPAVDHAELDRKLLEAASGAPRRNLSNVLPSALGLASGLIRVVLEQSQAGAETTGAELTRAERRRIVAALKSFTLTFEGLLGRKHAVVSSGGAGLEEVDFRTMQSRRCENLYLAGDILDFQRRSGGYSLQICWSSGWVAGENASAGELHGGALYYKSTDTHDRTQQ